MEHIEITIQLEHYTITVFVDLEVKPSIGFLLDHILYNLMIGLVIPLDDY